MTSRLEAADAIAAALEDDYSASVWSKGNAVRVYLTEVTRKSKGRASRKEIGFVSIGCDGSIDYDSLDYQRGTIAGLIADLNLKIEAVEPVASAPHSTESPDDPLERLEHEAARLNPDPLELG